jgi:transglutaminase-like putative cysteine protease
VKAPSDDAGAPLPPPLPGLTRLGALVVLLAGGLALGLTGMLAPEVCLLTLTLIVVVIALVPSWAPVMISDSRRRSAVALIAVSLLILATAASGPDALTSGGLQGTLALAVDELALPAGVPIGLLAALAAGALVAVALEVTDRRGTQSALVLGTAVLGLASVAAPGRHLIPVLVFGWPAALFTLSRLAGAGVDLGVDPALGCAHAVRPAISSAAGQPSAPVTETTMLVVPGFGGPANRALLRWQLLPVLVSLALSGALLTVTALTGVISNGGKITGWNPPSGFGNQAASRSSSAYLGGQLDLGVRGPLSKEPVLAVPTESPRLWRAGTLDLYTGEGWLVAPSAGPAKLTERNPDERYVMPESEPRSPGLGVARTDRVRPLGVAVQVFAPGRLISVSSVSLTGARIFTSPGDRLTVFSLDGGGLGEYQVESQPSPQVDDPLTGARLLAVGQGRQPGTAIDPRWTALPPTVPARVRQLGIRLVTGAGSRVQAVQAIEQELAQRVTYDLNSARPARGVDTVDDVLFTSHTGFCEQFASAEVVLLRAAGVPARIAVGFAGGQPGADGFRTMLGSDAHAWVEVWVPGIGWVSSDPTPAAPPPPGRWQSLGDDVRLLLNAPGTWILVALLLLLSMVGLFRWRQRVLVRRSAPRPLGPRVDPELAAAFGRLEAELTAQGRGRDQNETVAALARRLAADGGQSDRPTEFEQAFAVLERALYAPLPPSRQECLTAAGALVVQPTVETKHLSSTDLR